MRVYHLAGSLLACSPEIPVEQALKLAEIIVRLMIEVEGIRREAKRNAEASRPA